MIPVTMSLKQVCLMVDESGSVIVHRLSIAYEKSYASTDAYCYKFNSPSGCRRDKCTFLHQHDKRHIVDDGTSTFTRRDFIHDMNWNTTEQRYCKWFNLNGTCANGDKCPKLHEIHPYVYDLSLYLSPLSLSTTLSLSIYVPVCMCVCVCVLFSRESK